MEGDSDLCVKAIGNQIAWSALKEPAVSGANFLHNMSLICTHGRALQRGEGGLLQGRMQSYSAADKKNFADIQNSHGHKLRCGSGASSSNVRAADLD